MNQINCYNFIFHPLADNHSTEIKILAVITNIALAALTWGVYLLAFAGVHCMEPTQPTPLLTFATIPDQATVSPSRMTQREGFVGTAALKAKLIEHLGQLEHLAQEGQWKHIATHTNHPDSAFDWWMFPSDKPSRGQGYRYTVTKVDIAQLQEDKEFMRAYCRGIGLVLLSWGWDPQTGKQVRHPHPDQQWTGYTIRLEKLVYSLQLFGMMSYLRVVDAFIQAHHIRLAAWASECLPSH